MIPLTKRQRAALLEASKDRLAFGSACDFSLVIGDRDYSRFLSEEEGGLGIPDQDGPAVVLEGRLAVRLPEGLEGEECRVEHVVNGERILSYRGEIDWLEVKGYYSDFRAATASRRAEETPLGDGPEDDLEFVNREPSDALYEAVARVGGAYEGVDIPRVAKPLFTRSESVENSEPFRWVDAVSDVYEAIRTECKLAVEDTPLGVAKGRLDVTVFGDAEPEWVFEEGLDFKDGELSVKSRQEGRYARVVAWQEINGVPAPVGPKGGAKVDNQGRRVRQDATYLLQHTDASEDTAYEATYKKAIELADNAKDLEFPCEYPPFFLQRGDPVLVRGREFVPDGKWVREYRARLTSVAPDLHERTGKLKAVGGLVSEVFVERKRGPAIPRADAVKALYGLDFLNDPYFDESLPWVKDAGEHVELDEEVAALYGITIYEDPAAPGVVVVGG